MLQNYRVYEELSDELESKRRECSDLNDAVRKLEEQLALASKAAAGAAAAAETAAATMREELERTTKEHETECVQFLLKIDKLENLILERDFPIQEVFVHRHVYIYIYIRIYTCICICTCISYIHICIHTHKHTHTRSLSLTHTHSRTK